MDIGNGLAVAHSDVRLQLWVGKYTAFPRYSNSEM